MAYKIEITDLAIEELKDIKTFERRRIVDAIRNQLVHQPTLITRNRKRLHSAVPSFEYTPPIWELRVGKYRIFYDADSLNKVVYIRAARLKGRRQMTKDII